MVAMHEPWMLLDMWGNPVLAKTFLDGREFRAVGLEEFRTLADRCDWLAGPLAKYQDGDTIFWHNSPHADWAVGMGSEGYVLVRDQYLVASVVIRMN
jgi:hypothetical protein